MSSIVWAQAILTNAAPTLTIDFSNTMPTSVGSNPSTAYAGAGFEPNPTTAGRLNSNAWAATGWSNGSLAFGGTQITANTDYTRGATTVAVSTGGFFSYTGTPGSAADPTFMIQPGGSDFAPGTLTLRIQNNGTSSITQLDVSYNIYLRNDQGRSSSFNFSYSADDVSYAPVAALDYATPAVSDANGWVVVAGAPSRSTSITGINILPGGYFYIRWSSADVSGSGSRDELGLDDIGLTATYGVVSTPDVTLSSPNPAVPAGNLPQGSTNFPIYRFDLAVATANATLTGVTINTAGTYAVTDFSNFRCWYSADNVFDPGTDVLLSTISPVTAAGTQVFTPFTNQVIASPGNGYIFITANANCAAALNDISVNAITTADITFTSANKTGTASAGGLQTITAATPNNVGFPAASVSNASSSLSWANPAGCRDEIMIVASATAPNSGGTPTGDGTAYTGDLAYGNGTVFGNGFVVYKGLASPQVVTNLINGTTYYYKFFTRFGTSWSSGVEVNATPAQVTSPTDYFRTAGDGAWADIATWQSSSDSTSWIAATLFPASAAEHVVIQAGDSVWLTANASTKNLTVLTGGIVNANAFNVTASNRFNLKAAATYYQAGGGTTIPGTNEKNLDAASNYHFNGTQAGGSGSYPEFGNLFWEAAPSGNGTIVNSNFAAPFFGGLVVRGNLTINMQSATPTELRFATGSAAAIRTHTINGNLNIIGANTIAVVSNGTTPVLSTVNLDGNLVVDGGTLRGVNSSGQAIINLKGYIANNAGTVLSGAGSGTFSINYVGTAAQTINNAGGTYTFAANQVDSINNSAATVSLLTPLTHSGTIHFLNGVFNTTVSNLLTMDAGSAVLDASNNSFVNGPVAKIGNTDFAFPVGTEAGGPAGNAKGYMPVTISGFVGGTPTDQFTAQYVRGNAAALGPITAIGLNHVSSCDYWTLNRDLGTATVDVKLAWQESVSNCSSTTPFVNNLPSLVVAHFDGTEWNSIGATSTATGSASAGEVSWPGASVFSPFAIGSIDFSNPLPITLNYFNGTKQGSNHQLAWKVTCNATPHLTMLLQRSSDGQNFSSINSVTADAARCNQPFNYTDASPLPGNNYYRLKITGADGKISYSKTVLLLNATKGFNIISIAPNPVVNKNFTLNVTTANAAKMNISIIDMQGRVMSRQTISLVAGYSSLPVNVAALAPGTYTLCGNMDGEQPARLRFVLAN